MHDGNNRFSLCLSIRPEAFESASGSLIADAVRLSCLSFEFEVSSLSCIVVEIVSLFSRLPRNMNHSEYPSTDQTLSGSCKAGTLSARVHRMIALPKLKPRGFKSNHTL